MKRITGVVISVLILVTSISGCLLKEEDEDVPRREPYIFNMNGRKVKVLFSVSDGMFKTYNDGKWEEILVKGVNLGMGKPGYFPGEAGITKEEYGRWISQMGDMHANAIRVYTIHPPAFYEALLEYNLASENPIYLLHGVWMRHETLHSYPSIFEESIRKEFKDSMEQVVDVVHGNKELVKRPGHAHGKFRADVSDYLMGYILGVEWDPHVVLTTDDLEDDMPDIEGRFIKTDNASPFEIWLAEMMDDIMEYETDKYRFQCPMSFVNWVTTDKLNHPNEPFSDENMVSIDPDNITTNGDHYPSLFASYHIYPYYPDSLNFDSKYRNYTDHRGEKNNYAAYVHDMVKSHVTPILIAEFGIPSSRAMTHRNIDGLHQGNMTEQQQGEAVVRLFEDMVEEDCMGGLVFSWQDEWFKRTWNTMDYMDPNKRAYWRDVQTCEQNFGLLCFDPGHENRILIDGNIDDWTSLSGGELTSAEVTGGPVKSIMATSDEAYLYLGLELNRVSVDWETDSFHIYLDTLDDMGITAPSDEPFEFSSGIEFRIDVRGPDHSKMMVDSHYDFFYYQYAEQLELMEKRDYPSTPDNGIFHDIYYCVNRPLYLPETDSWRPLDRFHTGNLKWGTWDPSVPDFDSNADIQGPVLDPVIEMRIPWLLLGARDPTERRMTGDIWKGGFEEEVEIGSIGISLVTKFSQDKSTKITSTFPESKDGIILRTDMMDYSWEKWTMPSYHERLKVSYYLVQNCFSSY